MRRSCLVVFAEGDTLSASLLGQSPFPTEDRSWHGVERDMWVGWVDQVRKSVVGQVLLLNLTYRMLANKILKKPGFRCQVELRNLTYALW